MESEYRILSDKSRSIAGISMGGYGALLYSVKLPEMFSCCVAMSAGIVTSLDVKYMPDNMYALFTTPFGSRTSDKWELNNIFSLIKKTL